MPLKRQVLYLRLRCRTPQLGALMCSQQPGQHFPLARAFQLSITSDSSSVVASVYAHPPKRPPPSLRSSTKSWTLLKCLPSNLCLSSVFLVFWLIFSVPSPPLTVSLRLSNAAINSFPLPPSTAVFVADAELVMCVEGVSGMR
jgi:hypothetical protein